MSLKDFFSACQTDPELFKEFNLNSRNKWLTAWKFYKCIKLIKYIAI